MFMTSSQMLLERLGISLDTLLPHSRASKIIDGVALGVLNPSLLKAPLSVIYLTPRGMDGLQKGHLEGSYSSLQGFTFNLQPSVHPIAGILTERVLQDPTSFLRAMTSGEFTHPLLFKREEDSTHKRAPVILYLTTPPPERVRTLFPFRIAC